MGQGPEGRLEMIGQFRDVFWRAGRVQAAAASLAERAISHAACNGGKSYPPACEGRRCRSSAAPVRGTCRGGPQRRDLCGERRRPDAPARRLMPSGPGASSAARVTGFRSGICATSCPSFSSMTSLNAQKSAGRGMPDHRLSAFRSSGEIPDVLGFGVAAPGTGFLDLPGGRG